MKQLLKNKRARRFINILLGIIFLNLFIYYFITSEYNQFLNWEEIKTIKSKIRETPVLSENIYNTISEIHQMKRLNSHLILKPFTSKGDCPSLLVSYTSVSGGGTPLPYATYKIQEAMVYERYFSNKQLLSYYINQFDFLYGQIGIKNAAQFYFNKSLEDLNDKEIKTLAVMIFNPSLYNPRKNPDRLQKILNEF